MAGRVDSERQLMTARDARQTLEQLIRERREDYATLSRLLGRNQTYVQQYIKRGVPRKLDETDRRKLAIHFNVDESILGGLHPQGGGMQRLVIVAQREEQGDACSNPLPDQWARPAPIGFDERWLGDLVGAGSADLALFRVTGDSMAPTLSDGDDILINSADAAERLRDGIYVIKSGNSLLVRRVALSPLGGSIIIQSDNNAYAVSSESDPAQLQIVGRVIWMGRRIC